MQKNQDEEEATMKLGRIKEGTGRWPARVVRGGGWYSYFISYLRAASRNDGGPSYQYNYIGARLSRRIKTKKRQR